MKGKIGAYCRQKHVTVSHSIVIYSLSNLLSILGGLIIVNNWVAITTDAVAPDTVRDLKLQAAVPGSGEFVISWTAPGDDPGYGSGMLHQ